MSIKKKLLITVASSCLVIAMLMVGVWALKNVSFSVGGDISFTATGINATISKGTLAGGSWFTSADADTKMQEVVLNTNKTQAEVASEFASWQGLNLLFNENGEDVTISFTIKNNSTTANDAISVFVSVGGGTMKNATASINKSAVVIAPDTTETFEITFSVTDTTANASLMGFQIGFEMSAYDSTPKETTLYENLTFSLYSSTNKTLYVEKNSSNLPTGNLVIPEKVIYSGEEYSVVYLASSGFASCTDLKNVAIPSTVTEVLLSAFQNCTGLTVFSLPDTITGISGSAFQGCTNLKSINLPDGITSIGEKTFYGCENLAKINLNNIKGINLEAFYGCSSLNTVEFSSELTLIGDRAFGGCDGLLSIEIPATTTIIGMAPFIACENLYNISVDSGNGVYNSNDNCNAIIATGTNELVQGCNSTLIPSSVKTIGNQAFSGMTNISSILIPSGVESVGMGAFYGCSSLTVLEIPNSVTNIGQMAFAECSSLKNIVIPGSITKINSMTFSNCSGLESVTMNNGVTEIGEAAFDGCSSITVVTIPASVTIIGGNVFSSRNITDVYYLGTEEQWNNITMSLGNENLTSATIHYNG